MLMAKFSWRSTLGSTKQVLWNLVLIAVGSMLCAVGINGILIPQQFLSGGVTGVAIAIRYLVPSLPIAMLYFILNIPIYALGWMYVGRRFFLYSIAGLLIFSGALIYPNVLLPVHDKILSALLAGIIIGVGSGIILRSLGSAGGLDILSIILMKRFSIRLGSSVLAFNALILGAGAVLFSLEMALYTLVYLYVNSSMMNLVVMGLSQRKAVHIISPQWETITQEINEKIQRGVTIMRGQGGYSSKEHQILYTVITSRELARLKRLISAVDPNAFVVVTDTLEVMGQRVGNQPHW
jgi:uncharacterized membrane-anchored protein YitT (DUF2179 family)